MTPSSPSKVESRKRIDAREHRRILELLATKPIAEVFRLTGRSYLTLARLAAAQEPLVPVEVPGLPEWNERVAARVGER